MHFQTLLTAFAMVANGAPTPLEKPHLNDLPLGKLGKGSSIEVLEVLQTRAKSGYLYVQDGKILEQAALDKKKAYCSVHLGLLDGDSRKDAARGEKLTVEKGVHFQTYLSSALIFLEDKRSPVRQIFCEKPQEFSNKKTFDLQNGELAFNVGDFNAVMKGQMRMDALPKSLDLGNSADRLAAVKAIEEIQQKKDAAEKK